MPRTSISIRAILLGGAAALACSAGSANAASKDKDEGTQLGEVIVTARRVAERLQETPVAVTALSAQAIQDRQLYNLTEAVRFAPNVQTSTAASGASGSSSVFIRGIGQIDFITTTEPGVGVYLDGVYLARVTGAALDLADVDRVEVLRGPQGTLFGRNTIGGAVNVVTKAPGNDFSAQARFKVGNQDSFEAVGSMGGAIVPDRVLARVSVLGRIGSGYGTNLTPAPGVDGELGKDGDVGGRIQLRFLPVDNLTIDLAADYLRHRGTAAPHSMVAFKPSAAVDAYNASNPSILLGPQLVNRDLDKIKLSTPNRDDLEVSGVALTGMYELGSTTLKSISSYRRQTGHSGQDFDGTAATFLDQFIDSTQSQFSQEFQATGRAMDDRLKWIGGLYYFTEKGRFDSAIVLSNTPITILTRNKTESYAAYGQATYSLTDRLSATVGGRYTKEKKELNGITTLFGPFVLVPPTSMSDTFSNFSPKAGLEFKASEDLLVYASVTRGFRSGGFNGRPFSPTDLTPFDAEKVTTYETGFKSEWFDRRLRFNSAAFKNDYKDIQLTAVTTGANGATIVRTGNAATAELYGFETEFEARPTKGLSLFGSAGYLHNKLQEKQGFTFGATKLPTAPKWTYSAGAQYETYVTDSLKLTLGADATGTTSYAPQFDPSPEAKIPSYTLVNARIAIGKEDQGWSVAAFVKNAFDKRYRTYAQAAGSQDVTVAWFGPSRRFGIEASFRY